jgi:hypothetical protein
MSTSGGGFRIDPEELRQAAGQMSGHADEVGLHGSTLNARTAGRVGHGPIGEVADNLIRRGLNAVAHGATSAVSRFYRSIDEGLKGVASRTEQADAEAMARIAHSEHVREFGVPGVTTVSKDTRAVGAARRRLDDGGPETARAGAARGSVIAPPFSTGRLRQAWDAGMDTQAGRAYYLRSDTGMRKLAAVVPAFPGEYAVDMHGAPDRVLWGRSSFSAGQLAELVTNDPNWQNRPVRLFSCNTGKGSHPIAQALADDLHAPVTAPTELVWSDDKGNHMVTVMQWKQIGGTWVPTPGQVPPGGGWKTFYPTPPPTTP